MNNLFFKKLNKKEYKKVSVIMLLVIFSFIFACTKNNINVNETIEMIESTINETEKVEKIPSIQVDDIDDSNIKSILLRIDSVNQILGKDIAVSRDDFFNYRDKKICLIGDSIADCSKSSLVKYFPKISIDATPGREIATVVQFYKNAKKYDKLGEIVVISLGTNAITGIPFDLLEQVYSMLDGRPMIMLSVVMPYAGQERNRNRDIKKFIETHENCYLADWNKVVKNHPEYFVEDRIHPNGAGGEIYTQLLLKTVADIYKEKK